ncbi:hypothetical protein [Nonomuraea sp. NPDC050202]|uniref:hypothetical protein n=1 Tax=Nonomuraea sp. NPDC050202 TaxID=3155035 RepID=UPI0033D1A2D8
MTSKGIDDRGPLSLRLDTDAGTALGVNPDDVSRFMGLAAQGLLVAKDCTDPAVQDDKALDPSRTVSLASALSA